VEAVETSAVPGVIAGEVMKRIYRDWGDPRDQHLVGSWYAPLPQRVVNDIQPLAFAYAKWAWENVFAGVKHPCSPLKATGWMNTLFKSRDRQAKLAARTGKSLKEVLIEQFGWHLDEEVVLLHAPEHGYQTKLVTFLENNERFLCYFDTGFLCHASDRNVVVFWDGAGPYFGRRRDRSLAENS
jgi:hypothetical protein